MSEEQNNNPAEKTRIVHSDGFERIFRYSPDAMSIAFIEDSRYIDVNDEFQRMTGLKREEILGRTPWELGFWEDASDLQNFGEDLLRLGEVRNRETVLRVNGHTRVALVSAFLMDMDGRQVALGISRDITELRRTQDELRAADQRLSQVLQIAPIALTAIDLEGRITVCDGRAISSAGFRSRDMIGRTPADLIPDQKEFVERYDRALRGEISTGQASINGVDFEVWYSPLRDADGSIVGATAIGTDISERLRAEREMRRSERFYRSLIESSSDIIAVINRDAKLLFVGGVGTRDLEYTPEETVGHCAFDFIHLEDREEQRRAVQSALAEPGRIVRSQARLTAKSGAFIPFEFAIHATTDADGNPFIVIVMRNITERLHADERLRTTERELRTVLTNAPVAMTAVDAEGRVTVCEGEAMRAIYGDLRRFLGANVFDLPQAPNGKDYFSRALRGETFRASLEAEGHIFDVWYTPIRGDNGTVAGAIGIGTDVTERTRAEAALRESERYYRSLVEASSDLVAAVDESRTIIFIGGRGRSELGYEAEEIIGHSPFDFEHPDDISSERVIMGQVFATPGTVFRSQLRLRAKDGTWVPYEFAGVSSVGPGGQKILVTNGRNIVERKRHEEELGRARDQALAASRAKSEFVSSMSHEIRTPMNAILGMADLLSETGLSSEQRRYIDTIQNNGNALMELINGVLDFAKIESGRLSLEYIEFDLMELAEQVTQTLAIRAHEKNLELVLKVAPDVATLLIGDPLRVRQVLINLVGNAIKFTNSGEVTVTIERDPDEAGAGALRFIVADTGIGIPRAKLARIFSPFTQADSSTTRQFGGSGLGLAIVERLVTMMGGRVWVESEVDVGSRFCFTARFQEAGHPRPIDDPQPLLKGARVLLVDDNDTSRSVLLGFLASAGASVVEASSGAAALRMLEAAAASGASPHLMIIDFAMPGMNGLELTKQVRRTERQPNAIIMMLPADGLTATASRMAALGIQEYVVKPVRQRELLAAIDRVSMGSSAVNGAAAEPASTSSAPIIPPAGRVLDRHLRVLLADDSVDNRLLISAYVRHTPYEIEMAENGRVAFEKFIAEQIDLILMDIQMPVLDGYSATRMIRQWENDNHRPRTPIIALSASALDESVQRAKEAGCDFHVSKPVRRAVLLDAIADAVEPEPTPLQ